jgi:hypothetical protein
MARESLREFADIQHKELLPPWYWRPVEVEPD